MTNLTKAQLDAWRRKAFADPKVKASLKKLRELQKKHGWTIEIGRPEKETERDEK